MARTLTAASDNLRRNFAGLLKARGVSLRQFCRDTETDLSGAHKLASGKQGASLDRVATIAAYFDVSIGDLCDGVLAEVLEAEADTVTA